VSDAVPEWLRLHNRLFGVGLQDEDIAPLAQTVESFVPLFDVLDHSEAGPDDAFPAYPPGHEPSR
jgi:hypothetical protein